MYTKKDKYSAIDYCKGRISSLKNALKPLPFERFNQQQYNKNSRKLKHYEVMLEAVVALKGDDEE